MPMPAALAALLAAALLPAAAAAHEEVGVAGGFIDGALHPLMGLDHLAAMVAVGLWGAQLGRPLVTALPIAFPMMMAVGALAAVMGWPAPGIEIGIGASALGLGLFILLGWRAPVWAAVALVGVFAVFHGSAHGEEMPSAVNPLAYGVGFVLSTGLLHAAGILIGEGARRFAQGGVALRACGAGVAAVGALATANALAAAL